MRINWLVNTVFDGWEPTDIRLGGTEESVVMWAEKLVQKGHDVYVYRNGRLGVPATTQNGVTYVEHEAYKGGGDVCINVKASDIAPIEPTLYLTNEMNARTLDLSAYAGVIWPSLWAEANLSVNNPVTAVLPHGYDPDVIYPGIKIPKLCLYASSPDRGLDVLAEAWPKVYAAHSDALLMVTYGGSIDLPGVINLGDIDIDTMDDLYRTSDIWCHPCTGVELYCMTGKKAQAAGCIPVIIPAMALSETVARGYKTTVDGYAQTLIEVLSVSDEHRDLIRKDVVKHANAVTWDKSTDMLLSIIKRVL